MAIPKDLDKQADWLGSYSSLGLSFARLNAEALARLQRLSRTIKADRTLPGKIPLNIEDAEYSNLASERPPQPDLTSIGEQFSLTADKLAKAYLESLSLDELRELQARVTTMPDGSDGVAISWILDPSGNLKLISGNDAASTELFDMADALDQLRSLASSHTISAVEQKLQHEALNFDFYETLARIRSRSEESAQ